MNVELIDKMGSDLSVVNAARVSYSKESEWEMIMSAGFHVWCANERDEKLVKYLATHNTGLRLFMQVYNLELKHRVCGKTTCKARKLV